MRWTQTPANIHTRTHNLKNTSPASGTAFPAETETTQLAVPSLLCFAPCIYHSETNGLLALSHFNEPWGAAGGTFISAVLLQFTATCVMYTRARRKRQRGTTAHLDVLMERSIMSQRRRGVFKLRAWKGKQGATFFSQFGTSEGKLKMMDMGGLIH